MNPLEHAIKELDDRQLRPSSYADALIYCFHTRESNGEQKLRDYHIKLTTMHDNACAINRTPPDQAYRQKRTFLKAAIKKLAYSPNRKEVCKFYENAIRKNGFI